MFKLLVVAKLNNNVFYVSEADSLNALTDTINYFYENGFSTDKIRITDTRTVLVFHRPIDYNRVKAHYEENIIVPNYDCNGKQKIVFHICGVTRKCYDKKIREVAATEEQIQAEFVTLDNCSLLPAFDTMQTVPEFYFKNSAEISNLLATGEDFVKYLYLDDCYREFEKLYGKGAGTSCIDLESWKPYATKDTKLLLSRIHFTHGGLFSKELGEQIKEQAEALITYWG